MKLQMVGLSHHTAPVQIRERLAFSKDQAISALARLRQRYPETEAVLLSTCNRVELYVASETANACPTHHDVVAFLAEFHGLDPVEIFGELFERTLLEALRDRGIAGAKVLLVEDRGAPADFVAAAAATGGRARTYDSFVTEEGLLGLAGVVDGVSVGKGRLVGGPRSSTDAAAAARRVAPGAPLRGSELVDAAHAAGLAVFTWTLRPENRFLAQPYRRGATRSAWGDWLGEFTRIMRMGVDGVFLDHPDLGLEARRALAAS